MNRLPAKICLIALFALAVVGAYLYWRSNGPPGGQPSLPVGPSPGPQPAPKSPLEPFRSPWNALQYPNWPVSVPLAKMSDIVYFEPSVVEEAFPKLGFSKVEAILSESMVAYVATAGDVAVIAIRGTDDVEDWIVNANILSHETKKGLIHKGFFIAYAGMKHEINRILKRERPKHLWITGHSLGGALAAVCAFDLAENTDFKIDGVMTFGQPMIAKEKLAESLDKMLPDKYVHFAYRRDVVTHMPLGYVHFGQLVWFKDDDIIEVSRIPRELAALPRNVGLPDLRLGEIKAMTAEEFEEIKRQLRANEREIVPNDRQTRGNALGVDDHSMSNYLREIESICGIAENP